MDSIMTSIPFSDTSTVYSSSPYFVNISMGESLHMDNNIEDKDFYCNQSVSSTQENKSNNDTSIDQTTNILLLRKRAQMTKIRQDSMGDDGSLEYDVILEEYFQRVKVRHEETETQLARNLALICCSDFPGTPPPCYEQSNTFTVQTSNTHSHLPTLNEIKAIPNINSCISFSTVQQHKNLNKNVSFHLNHPDIHQSAYKAINMEVDEICIGTKQSKNMSVLENQELFTASNCNLKINDNVKEDDIKQSDVELKKQNSVPLDLKKDFNQSVAKVVEMRSRDEKRNQNADTRRSLFSKAMNKKKANSKLKRVHNTAVRFQVDLKNIHPYFVGITVNEELGFLRVLHIKESCNIPSENSSQNSSFSLEQGCIEPIHLLRLGCETRLDYLACSVEDGVLFVRERSKPMEYLGFNAGTEKSLPIVIEDDEKCLVIVTFLVPKPFDVEPVIIKTIDDTLYIFGSSNEYEGIVEKDGGFKMMMKLPNGTFTRSIEAWRSSLGQIIVRGMMAPNDRRMTCDF